MNRNTVDDCIVCRKHNGEGRIAGGAIFENELIFISHVQLWGENKTHYLGHLLVVPKRHVAGLADLSDEEAQAVGLYTSRAAKALLATVDIEHIYTLVMGDHVPHVHVHVIGRYVGAPRGYWGTKVDEWPEAPRGDESEIDLLAGRLRDYFSQQYGVLESSR